MRGLGAAARRGAHLPSSYAAAFSSFSGVGGGGAGRGRGRGSGTGPSPFGQPRAPGRPIPDDDAGGADPFSAPPSDGRGLGESVVPRSPTIPSFSGAGRGRGESVVPSSPTIPSFSGAGRGRGSPLPPPPAAEDAPEQHIAKHPDDASRISDPERPGPGAPSFAVPRSIPSTGAGRGVPRFEQPPVDKPPEENRFIRHREAKKAPEQHVAKRPDDASSISDPERPGPGAPSFAVPRSIPSTGAGRGTPRFEQPPVDKPPEENRFIRRREAKKAAASPSAPSTQPKLSAEESVKRAMELLGKGDGPSSRGGRDGRGRGRDRGPPRPRVDRDEDERNMIYLGDDADGEKLEKRLGTEKMKILEQAFDEAAETALPHPMEDAYMDACHTNNMIEFEPEYHVNFDNPDIDEKPPMSLEEMLQKVKPFIVAYEGIKNQEEWEEAVKDVMVRAPHMKELIDMYSGPDVVTAKQQEQELQRVASTLPEKIPSSVNRFTQKMLLSLKNNPGWGFDKKYQFMDKFAREVSNIYK